MLNLAGLFMASAWAQDAAAPAAPSGSGTSVFMNFVPLVLIFAVFYVLIIRPQQKKMDLHGQMLKALRRGDRIITGGGIHGIIHKIENDEHLIVEIADGVRIKVVRSTISALAAKTEPVVGDKPANDTISGDKTTDGEAKN